ncbi:hypothetical protein ONZ43_g3608 [Nemania bipapillata]|uniref:Uncharacterized protein n=1 Tax=Nemania bipapillata TaxID=110536 RepID=A0ACC2IWA0_9PEZI|nr:hypothetical protein ONZ43_g3608 [Nemania bipapillata]
MAREKIPKDLGFYPEISPTVLLRYEKALYIMNLVSILFSWKTDSDPESLSRSWGVFWLLHKRITRVLYRANAQYTFEDKRFDKMARFIIRQGPRRLWDLEMEHTPNAMKEAWDHFRILQPFDFLSISCCNPGFGLPLQISRTAEYSNLDLGPMNHWYRMFKWRCVAMPQNTDADPLFFACVACLSNVGYALWDDLDDHGNLDPGRSIMNTMAGLQHAESWATGCMANGYLPVAFRDWECLCGYSLRQPNWNPGFSAISRDEEFTAQAQALAEPLERARLGI